MGENSAGKKTLLQVRAKDLALLNVLFLIYSFVAVCQKFAFNNGKNELFSAQFFLFIGIAFVLLAVYALLWQQVLKRVPLSVAYSNKGITLLWGLLWGFVFFRETATLSKWNTYVGIALVLAGILLVVWKDGGKDG